MATRGPPAYRPTTRGPPVHRSVHRRRFHCPGSTGRPPACAKRVFLLIPIPVTFCTLLISLLGSLSPPLLFRTSLFCNSSGILYVLFIPLFLYFPTSFSPYSLDRFSSVSYRDEKSEGFVQIHSHQGHVDEASKQPFYTKIASLDQQTQLRSAFNLSKSTSAQR